MKKNLSKVDREYREKLRKKNKLYFIAIILMLICLAILLIGTNWYKLKISYHAVGFLSGFFLSGSGVFVVYIYRNHSVISDPDKLKRHRIVRTDERNREIYSKSIQISCYLMTVVLVILSMVGSFVSRSLMLTATGLLYFFFISYLISYFYFRKKL